jgi:hypothetical protein
MLPCNAGEWRRRELNPPPEFQIVAKSTLTALSRLRFTGTPKNGNLDNSLRPEREKNAAHRKRPALPLISGGSSGKSLIGANTEGRDGIQGDDAGAPVARRPPPRTRRNRDCRAQVALSFMAVEDWLFARCRVLPKTLNAKKKESSQASSGGLRRLEMEISPDRRRAVQMKQTKRQ